MPRFLKNLDPLPAFSPAMSEGITRVLTLVRPKKQDHDACRRDAMDAIRMIGGLEDLIPPSVLKQRLFKADTQLNAARAAIVKLPMGVQIQWNAATLLGEMARFSQTCKDTADGLSVKTLSGGSLKNHVAAIQKQFAAGQAFDLLTDWGHRRPTLTRNGEYHRLTKLLIEIATGHAPVGDVERACARIMHSI
ncbi:MAG: hypothetical protein JWP25_6545 [Bradyrhizobium sp.]|nr:hypothetical protein [Bradyrhizobium sp.]